VIAGGVVYPAIFHKLQPRIGFDWTTRVIAFIMLATLMIPITVMRAKTLPSIRRPFIDLTVLRELSFDLYSFGFFFGMMGLYIPFYYMSTYSIENDIVEENLGFYLLIIINAASIFGRIVPNFFADTIGLLNISAPFCCTCTIIAFCWTSVTSPGQAIVFCLFYGFFSGTFVSISPLALAALATDPTLVGTHMGMGFTCGGLGLLIGNPVAGLLLDNYGWIGPAMFCGAASAMATVCILMARISKTGRVVMVKV
jgi:predicted MFS family arabinose efflux permease